MRLVLPDQLRELSPGGPVVQLTVGASTVRAALGALREAYPAIHRRLVTETGALRPHLNLFVGREDIRWSGGLDTPLRDGAEITILRAVSGG